jgi:exopolyphosphatase/guanosine-5'-triphosphate,3'-diphosphate pyrophosphatase
VTVDIGGGSTEFAKVVNGKVVKTITLQLGHVRVYEKAKSMDEKKALIDSELKKLDSDFFSKRVVTIGGSAREIAKFIQKKEDYPLYKCLHAYSYSDKTALKYMKKLIEYDHEKIKKYISKSRQETIQDGTLVLYEIVKLMEPKEIVVSSFGVREGVYLSDLLRSFNSKFPSNFKLNQRVLLDRFGEVIRVNNYYQNIANKLYPYIFKDDEFKEIVSYCSKLLLLNSMNFYSWIEYLNFAFTHKQKVMIAYLMQSFSDEELDEKLYKKYKSLLPDFKKLEKLFFILNLTAILAKNMKVQNVKIEKEDDLLSIMIDISDLTKDEIESLEAPYKIKIESR